MRIAIRQIDADDTHAIDISLDIARLLALAVLGAVDPQTALDLDRLAAIDEDRDTVEALLTVPDRLVTQLCELVSGKAVVLALDLLQASDGGPRFRQPFLEARQPRLDAVDVECRDFHGGGVPENSRRV